MASTAKNIGSYTSNQDLVLECFEMSCILIEPTARQEYGLRSFSLGLKNKVLAFEWKEEDIKRFPLTSVNVHYLKLPERHTPEKTPTEKFQATILIDKAAHPIETMMVMVQELNLMERFPGWSLGFVARPERQGPENFCIWAHPFATAPGPKALLPVPHESMPAPDTSQANWRGTEEVGSHSLGQNAVGGYSLFHQNSEAPFNWRGIKEVGSHSLGQNAVDGYSLFHQNSEVPSNYGDPNQTPTYDPTNEWSSQSTNFQPNPEYLHPSSTLSYVLLPSKLPILSTPLYGPLLTRHLILVASKQRSRHCH